LKARDSYSDIEVFAKL